MADKLDKFLDDLQEKVFDEARGVLGDKGFDRWQNPRYRGRLPNYTVHGHALGDCGDSMDIYLRFDKDRVAEASYMTDGCGSSQVCGSFAAEMSTGRRAEELADITGEVILEKLGDVPEDDQHCAFLAAGTVQEALRIYMTGAAGDEGKE
ncbi:MAG: iron-sulfur cluster assembly scaffold protein [Desulfobacterium sp.]|nr:iron-sulfur cluster assembly scaffold protein [Desulfobacterium sp.]